MSEIHEELLGRGVSIKRIIGVFAVAGLLIGVFVFQTTIFSVILGTEKVVANEELEFAPFEDPELFLIPPPFDLEDLLAMLSPDQLASLLDMLDGQIDDLDLGDYAAMLAALLLSEVEVFRIYNYDVFNDMSSVLWKYEAFDSYDGSTWSTTASPSLTTFADYDTYYNTHQAMGADLLKLQRVLTPSLGTNALVAGTIFSDPLIMDSSITSVNTTNLNEAASALYVDEFNCSVLELTFTTTDTAKIEYELYGLPGLPDATTLNNSAVDESFTPVALKNQYLLLPPSIAAYRANNNDFNAKCIELEAIIHPSDNAFQVANKIRNYIQDNFTGGMAGLQIYQNNPPADGQDGIEWFCEQEGGLWTHFASAYTAFCRVFGVASRFIDGFNSRNVVEENDGDDFFAVKYKNIYNWAEVYVPTNVDGSGVWVQMDVQYESFGEGGAPIAEGTFNIEVEVDSSINNTIYCNRDEYLKFKATLTSSDSSVDNRKILFVDTISQTLIGEATTDATGVATTYIQFDSSLMVGPHYIGALFQDAFNSTLTFLVDDVAIALYSVSPTDVDRAASNNFTIVTGNIYDPNHDTFDPIENATLNFVLLANGTETRVPGYPLSAFTPNSVVTDENGDFSIQIYVNNGSLVPNGYYQVRIDFNGTWAYDDGDLIFPLVNGSSNKQSLNVTGFIDKLVWFYIEGYENDDFNNPEVNRWDGLNLTATVINETTGLPIVGENVSFWDYTQGDLYIGNDFTDINGNASISYFGVTNSRMPGPNLLYALANPVVNYSYFIVNDSSQITIDVSGPNPMIINRTSPGILSFTINGNITGNIMGDRLRGALISLQMYKLGYDNTTYLDPNPGSVQVGADGSFSFNYEADDDTPQGNYTLLVRFNGRINHNWGPYPHDFNIPKLNKSMAAVNDLRILASDIFIFNFWINDTTSDNVENPIINSDEYYGLKVYLQGGADPLTGERVDFYDLTQNKSLGYAITDLSGYAKLDLQANWSMCAGPHLIRALYDGDNINDSYYIKNEQIYVNVNFGPNPNTVDKSGTSNRLFYIEGQVQDLWAIPVPYARLAIRMFGIGGVDETAYLLPQGPNQVDNYYYCNETGYFNASYYVHPSITAGFQKSELRVDFNGTFIYGQPYPYTFNLIGWSNFSDTDYAPNNNLTITDPDQISILMKANGSYLGSIFTDGNPPITVKEGDIVKLELNVTHSGIAPALFDQIIVRDVFANVNISTYTFPGGNGYVMLNISTAGNHSGLHKWELIFKDASFKVYDTTNSTYILINETVSMGASLGTPSITRSLDFWGISGIVSDGGQNLKAFEITLFLLDDSMQDVSYLLSIGGARTKVINPDGTYYYSGTISINAPHGLYYLVVNTTGGIQSTDAPLAISMVNAHTINSSSGNLAINVTAATDIKNEIYWSSADSPYPWLIDQWMAGYLLFVNGTLEYENGTAMVGVYVRVRVEHLNGTLISSGISTATDANGDFTITIDITSEFPDDRANSRIFIDFHPYNYGNNEGYVETDEQEVPI